MDKLRFDFTTEEMATILCALKNYTLTVEADKVFATIQEQHPLFNKHIDHLKMV